MEYSLSNTSIGVLNVSRIGNSYLFNYPCISDQSCTFYNVAIPQGDYKIELWGAQGGNCLNSSGGRGGYSYAFLKVAQFFNFSLYLGGKGVCLSNPYSPGGYNGGGQGGREVGKCWGASGGGASDIRVLGNTLYHRILVAGGGGGAGDANLSINYCYIGPRDGGHGGGLTGGSGSTSCGYTTSGGTQTSPGTTHLSYNKQAAAFGQGGSVIDASQSYSAGGGGAGWYGGAAGDAYGNSGSGGSGYILLPTSHIPSGYAISDKQIFSYGGIVNGETTMPSMHTDKLLIGNSGNGYAVITLLSDRNNSISLNEPIFNCLPSIALLHEFPKLIIVLFLIASFLI